MVSFSFQIATSLLAYVATFSGQLYFERSYFFTLFQSNYFDTTVTFSVQLFLQNSCFLYFFKTVTFSQELFFQNSFFFVVKLLQSSHFLRIGSSSRQLLFGTVIFSEELFRLKISKRELLLWSRYFCTASAFWELLYFGKKMIFQRSNSPHYLLFLESCVFGATTFSKDPTFYSSYLFRRATFLQHTFSEELLFHSFGFFPQIHFLFIC